MNECPSCGESDFISKVSTICNDEAQLTSTFTERECQQCGWVSLFNAHEFACLEKPL